MAFFPSSSWLECLGLHQLPWAMRNEAGVIPWDVGGEAERDLGPPQLWETALSPGMPPIGFASERKSEAFKTVRFFV